MHTHTCGHSGRPGITGPYVRRVWLLLDVAATVAASVATRREVGRPRRQRRRLMRKRSGGIFAAFLDDWTVVLADAATVVLVGDVIGARGGDGDVANRRGGALAPGVAAARRRRGFRGTHGTSSLKSSFYS